MIRLLFVLLAVLSLAATAQEQQGQVVAEGPKNPADRQPSQNINITIPENLISVDTTGIEQQIETMARNTAPDENADAIDNKRQETNLRTSGADLVAQRSMADSAVLMNRATWGSVIIGLIGLYLLGKTLSYTRDAAKTTKETLEVVKGTTKAELRAYIAMSDLKLKKFGIEGDARMWIDAEIPWNNVGQTPAYDVETSFEAEFSNSRENVPIFHKLEWRSHGDIAKGQSFSHHGYLDLQPDIVATVREMEGFIFVRSVVRYKDVFKRTIFYSKTGILGVTGAMDAAYNTVYPGKIAIRGPLNGETITDPQPETPPA